MRIEVAIVRCGTMSNNNCISNVIEAHLIYQCGSCAVSADGVATDFQAKLGSFFLTDDGVVGGAPSPLIITYVEPVAKASGNLLDIDGPEIWEIKVLDKAGVELGKVVLTAANGFDGGPSQWTFQFETKSIAKIVMTGSGSTSGFGLAFNRFSPIAVCAD